MIFIARTGCGLSCVGLDQSEHICHHAVFVGILTLHISSKMVVSRTSPRATFLPLSLVLVVTLVGRIAATDSDKNRTVSSIFPGMFVSALQWLYAVTFSYNVNLILFLYTDLGALATIFSKTVDEFLNNTLSMFKDLPPNYKNTSTEVGDGGSLCIVIGIGIYEPQNNTQFHFVCGILF